MTNPTPKPSREELEYLTKVFEKFHTPDEGGRERAASYAQRVLDCMPKPQPHPSVQAEAERLATEIISVAIFKSSEGILKFEDHKHAVSLIATALMAQRQAAAPKPTDIALIKSALLLLEAVGDDTAEPKLCAAAQSALTVLSYIDPATYENPPTS